MILQVVPLHLTYGVSRCSADIRKIDGDGRRTDGPGAGPGGGVRRRTGPAAPEAPAYSLLRRWTFCSSPTAQRFANIADPP